MSVGSCWFYAIKLAVFRVEVSQISLSFARLLNSVMVSFLISLSPITFMQQDSKRHGLGFMLPSLHDCYRLNSKWVTSEILFLIQVFSLILFFIFAIRLLCLLFSFSSLSGFLLRILESSFYMLDAWC